ncbi:hypothetical protein Tco_0733026 [Tanacetum coccineum]
MYEIYESMETKVTETSKNANFNDEFDRFLEVSLAHDVTHFVMFSCVQSENENLSKEVERISKKSSDVQETKRALFTSPKSAKTRFLDAPLIAAKTRLVVANPLSAQNKASSSTLSTPDSKKAQTSRK